MKVIYLLNVFPKITETFILNEMLSVQEKGAEIQVFAYVDEKEDKVHPRVREIKNINYFFRANPFQIVAAHLYWIFRHPAGYLKTIGLVIRHGSGIRKLFMVHLYDTVRVDRRKPDHLHAHFGECVGDIAGSNLAMVLRSLSGVPYTFTTHAHDIFDAPPANYEVKTRLAKKHVTISEYNKRYLTEHFHADPGKIAVIHCGVDLERIGRLAAENPGVREKDLIFSVGRLYKDKGLDILIRACARLRDEQFSFRCVIAGDGIERAPLEALISQLGLKEKVLLIGRQTQDEVFGWFKKAAVMVLPSRFEGIPVSLMEAMAFRVPVISTKIYGIPELVEDGKNGFLVEPGDRDALVEKIKHLLKNESLLLTFAENGYRKVCGEYDLKKETDKLMNIWRS